MKLTNKVRLGAFAVLVLALITISLTVDLDAMTDQEGLRRAVKENIVKGSLLFVLAAASAKLLLAPVSLSVIGGYLFGGLWGAVLTMAALLLSSALTFIIGRYLGRRFVEEEAEVKYERLARYNRLLERHGLAAVIFFRLVPVLPLSAMNMLIGVTRVKASDFLVGSAIGLLPGVFLLSGIGNRLSDLTDPWLYVYAAAYLLLVMIAAAIANRIRKNEKKAP